MKIKWTDRNLLRYLIALVVVSIVLIQIVKYGELGWIVGVIVYFQIMAKLQWIEEGVRVNTLMLKELWEKHR